MNNVSAHGDYSNIFVLLGPCSAGKSSVISALKEKDPSWVGMGCDLAGFFHMADMIRETFPVEYEMMSAGLEHTEIAHAVVDIFYKAKEGQESNLSFIKWKPGTYSKNAILALANKVAKDPAFAPLDQSMYAKETADLINRKMINVIKSNSSLGFPVFVDSLEPGKIGRFLEDTREHPVKVGIAYLPLHHLADRVTKRNETAKNTGDEAEIRSYEQITSQFLDHYKLAQGEDNVIGHISLLKIEKAFSKMIPGNEEEAESL